MYCRLRDGKGMVNYMELLNIEAKGEGKYLKNYHLTYRNKEGREKHYEMVSHHSIAGPEDIGNKCSGVSIVALQQDKVLLLKEFRMGVNRNIYNLCAGRIEPRETMEECIRRELYEETGCKVKQIYKILEPSYAAVSFSDVMTQIAFIEAEGIIEDHTSANEEIEAQFYSREEVEQLLETELFSSRAQVIAYFFSRNLIHDMH